MEINTSSEKGKSRLSDQQLNQLRGEDPVTVGQSQTIVLKGTSLKLGTLLFGLFVLVVVGSVFFRLYLAPVEENPEGQSQIIVDTDQVGEEAILDDYGVVAIKDVEIEYSEPERAFHIERRQQFCARDIDEARRLYSEYIGEKNKQVMEIKPRTVSEDQWIKEKQLQGAYKENLGERETNYYYEYPTTGGTYVDLMRIHKCQILNPAGRIIPIVSVDEDGYIPEYELGMMGVAEMSEDEMVSYLQYLLSMKHEQTEILTVNKQSVGDFLTLTVELDYVGNANWIKLKKNEEAYREAIYKVNLKTGLLTYSEQLLSRVSPLPSPSPEE